VKVEKWAKNGEMVQNSQPLSRLPQNGCARVLVDIHSAGYNVSWKEFHLVGHRNGIINYHQIIPSKVANSLPKIEWNEE